MATVSDALWLAIQHHRANRLAEAAKNYQQVLAVQPDCSEALYGLGVLAQQQGQHQTAERFLKALLQQQPYSLKAWFSLGNLRQAQGQLSEAVEAYRRALALDPHSAAVHNNLGYTFQRQGQWEEASACYQKALDLQPNCAEAQVNWGNALQAKGKLSPEKQTYYATLNNDLGVARNQEGDLQIAATYFRQAIAINPDLAVAHYNLGMTLQKQGQREEAMQCYQQALALDSSKGEVYLGIGQIYQAQNQLKQAASAYQQGLRHINSRYVQAVEAYQGTNVAPEEQVPPPLQLGEVVVGKYKFPTIPPVSVREDERPFWSVIIPLYNRTNYLLECLTSVLAQWPGSEQMEILVMDNASTPPLADWVNSIGGGVVRYYRNPENIGARRNFNLGIALSRGQWIHLLPDDEYVLPGFYARLQTSLENCPDSVGAAYTGYENINEKGEIIFTQQHAGEHQGINQDWLWRIGVANPLNLCAVVIRRAAHERLGGYDPTNICAPDWELYKRIASFYDWWYEPGILARFRQHSHSMSTEVLLTGTQGVSYGQAIEISQSYLPVSHCAEITAKARSHYFEYCLMQAAIPLKAGNLSGTLRLLQEALKINRSSQAVTKLFTWLNEDEAAPLRDEIATLLLSVSLNDKNTLENLYFAYP